MNKPSSRTALLAGAALGSLAALPPALGAQLLNPWFLDSPWLYWALVSLPLALPGALLGLLLRRWLGRLPLAAALALLLASWAALPAMSGLWPRPQRVEGLRLLVVGIDGATYDIIDRMGEQLPQLRELMQRGTSARLQSMEPMFSPLLWTTMSTGRPPEAHGVHGFNVHADDCLVPRFWEIMQGAGLSTGIYKWLVSYPPQELDGFLVPAWLAPAPETWPPELSFVKELELSRRLKRKQVQAQRSTAALAWQGLRHGFRFSTLVAGLRYSLNERLSGPSPQRSHRDGQLLRVRMDRDVFVWLMHRDTPEVASFTDYATDAIGHRFWKYHQPDVFPEVSATDVARWGEALRDAYRQADQVLGELMDLAGPETRIVVLSDHGFQALLAEDSGMFFAPRTERLKSLLEEQVGPVEVSKLGHKVVVTCLGQDPALKKEGLERFLEGLVQASSGQPFYRWEEMGEDVRSLGLTLRDEQVTKQRIETDTVSPDGLQALPLSDFVRLTEAYSGVHARDGVFIAAGPDIAGGLRIDDLSLLDVTPILLTMAEIPPSLDMPGQVPDALWEHPPLLQAAPASYDEVMLDRVFTAGAEGVNDEMLKALGYID